MRIDVEMVCGKSLIMNGIYRGLVRNLTNLPCNIGNQRLHFQDGQLHVFKVFVFENLKMHWKCMAFVGKM
jgi:hypothetical protein